MFKSNIMTTIVFDMADPDIKALIDGWADDTEYTVTLKVRTGAGENRNVASVIDVQAEEMESEEVEEVAEAPEEKPAKKEKTKTPPIPY